MPTVNEQPSTLNADPSPGQGVADVLFVDDEQHILNSLRRVFRQEPSIRPHFAASPMEALGILASQNIIVIVTDHRMPVMTGAEFLSRVKEKRPSTIRIMLTGQADLAAVEKAVNGGEIFRFLTKPWQDEELRQAVLHGIQHYHLVSDNRRLTEITQAHNAQLSKLNEHLEEQIQLRTKQLADALYTARALNEQLEEGLYVSTKAMFSVIQLSRPELGIHSRQVAEHAVQIGTAMALKPQELRDLEIAALLHDGGKLCLPAFLSDKNIRDYSREEMDLYRTHPYLGADYLKVVPYYEKVCAIILAHHERWNGSGFPHALKGMAVPMESYIIGIADEYIHLMSRPNRSSEYLYQFTCQTIAEYADVLFPGQLVQTAIDHIEADNQRSSSQDVIKVGLADIVPQAVLARDLYTMTGALLAASGTCLTAQNIARIRSVAKIDPIAGGIYLQRRPRREQRP